jgi:hypothetical protein
MKAFGCEPDINSLSNRRRKLQPVEAVEDVDDVTLKIRKLEEDKDILEKRENHLIKQIEQQIIKAREFTKKGLDDKAKQCLKQSKIDKMMLESVRKQKDNQVTLICSIYQTQSSVDRIKSNQMGAEVMNALTKDISPDDVHVTIGDVNRGIDMSNRIQGILGEPIGDNTSIQSEVDDFKKMQEEALSEQLGEISVPRIGKENKDKLQLYSISNKNKRVTSQIDESEFEELERELNTS